MHVIARATLKPGVTLEGLPAAPSDESAVGSGVIHGKALIFWDPKQPGGKYRKKLDAIDTDQITPAADCVSESLETLDERWKAGSFRYLMPDFRERVHRGETFLIAGDRLWTLHDVQPEVEGVAPEDIAHVLAADDDELEPRLLGDAFEPRRAHLT